jgi:hypothetical protein
VNESDVTFADRLNQMALRTNRRASGVFAGNPIPPGLLLLLALKGIKHTAVEREARKTTLVNAYLVRRVLVRRTILQKPN